MWLSKEVFDWYAEPWCGGTITELKRVARPYEILDHAKQLVRSSSSSFVRADALANLKRAINVRLQHIEELYGFGEIFPRHIGALERLELVGLAKPFLIKQLFELRNETEHKDCTPPESARLSELVDITWYFLKATDPTCKLIPEGIVLMCKVGAFVRDPSLFITLYLMPGTSDRVEIAGWISLKLLQDTAGPGWLPLQLKVFREPSVSPISNDSISQITQMNDQIRGYDERWIEASVTMPARLLQHLWRLSLEVN